MRQIIQENLNIISPHIGEVKKISIKTGYANVRHNEFTLMKNATRYLDLEKIRVKKEDT